MNIIAIDKDEMIAEKKEKNPNVKVEEAAAILNKSPQFVRVALQQGILPIGIAVKVSEKRWNYHISRKKLEEYIGEVDNGRFRQTSFGYAFNDFKNQ